MCSIGCLFQRVQPQSREDNRLIEQKSIRLLPLLSLLPPHTEEQRTQECTCARGTPSQAPLTLIFTILPMLPPLHSILSSALTEECCSPLCDSGLNKRTLFLSALQNRLEFSKGTWPKTRDISPENTRPDRLTKYRFPKLTTARQCQASNHCAYPLSQSPAQRNLLQIIHRRSLQIFICMPCQRGVWNTSWLNNGWCIHRLRNSTLP